MATADAEKIGQYCGCGHKSFELVGPNLAWLAHDGATRNWRTEAAQDKVSMHITEEKEFFDQYAGGL